jgi:hypothetical protein
MCRVYLKNNKYAISKIYGIFLWLRMRVAVYVFVPSPPLKSGVERTNIKEEAANGLQIF